MSVGWGSVKQGGYKDRVSILVGSLPQADRVLGDKGLSTGDRQLSVLCSESYIPATTISLATVVIES